jgi:LacI family transcriptional regulator
LNNITLAKVANVSTNTVSPALNDKPDINPKTKKRILRIAEDLGKSLFGALSGD